jgi:hypothetical protein
LIEEGEQMQATKVDQYIEVGIGQGYQFAGIGRTGIGLVCLLRLEQVLPV